MRSKIVKRSTILLVCISIMISMLFSININANALTQSEMISKISAKYAQNTWLGKATTNYTYLGGGMFGHYERGSIYIGNNIYIKTSF
ncbi:MAG TPA: hypothetical protein VIO64_14750 [Pseudobacteroides sp.]|uniref:hypothetical protein n=1 Tax=Pseudobacteroides sp. TaxID=1968840 RepID=UPI002F949E65